MTDPAAILGLDHVVIAVHDLERAIADYRALGFTVAPGGRHPGRTSYNALVVFADGAYFELIAWSAPAPHERWWRVLNEHGEGFVDHALLPRDTPAALEAAQARGLHTLTGPHDGGRHRPDGVELKWQTARHATPDLPFLCGDVTPRAGRVPEGEARVHANGARGVAAIGVAVADLRASAARWQALLGSAVAMGAPGVDAATGLEGVAFTLGGTRFELQAPGPGTAAGHPLRRQLATRGEGPWRLRLAAAAGAPEAALDPARTHGATLSLGGAVAAA
jgi:catechol 2,3-dioxygenase-like lactoylglutathione lyase family enzyme